MNFKDALAALKKGKKIARCTWKGHQYLVIDLDGAGKEHVVSYTRRASIFAYDSDTLLTDNWELSNDRSKSMTWDEVVEALIQGGRVRQHDWPIDAYILYDKAQKGIVHYGMEIGPYTPNFESFMSNDWMVFNEKRE